MAINPMRYDDVSGAPAPPEGGPMGEPMGLPPTVPPPRGVPTPTAPVMSGGAQPGLGSTVLAPPPAPTPPAPPEVASAPKPTPTPQPTPQPTATPPPAADPAAAAGGAALGGQPPATPEVAPEAAPEVDPVTEQLEIDQTIQQDGAVRPGKVLGALQSAFKANFEDMQHYGQTRAKAAQRAWTQADVPKMVQGFKDNVLKGQPEPPEGIVDKAIAWWGDLETWQQVAVVGGVLLSVAGLANVMFGEGGFGSAAVAALGAGAAVVGSGAFPQATEMAQGALDKVWGGGHKDTPGYGLKPEGELSWLGPYVNQGIKGEADAADMPKLLKAWKDGQVTDDQMRQAMAAMPDAGRDQATKDLGSFKAMVGIPSQQRGQLSAMLQQ